MCQNQTTEYEEITVEITVMSQTVCCVTEISTEVSMLIIQKQSKAPRRTASCAANWDNTLTVAPVMDAYKIIQVAAVSS